MFESWEVFYQTLLGWLAWLWAFWEVKAIVAQVCLNTVLAIAVTIATGEFRLGRLAEFLYRKILPLVLVFAAFAIGAEAAGVADWTPAIWALLAARLLGDMIASLKELGVVLPDALGR